MDNAVEDPRFPDGGAYPRVWRKTLLFSMIVAKNCMKMKEIGPIKRGTQLPSTSLASTNALA